MVPGSGSPGPCRVWVLGPGPESRVSGPEARVQGPGVCLLPRFVDVLKSLNMHMCTNIFHESFPSVLQYNITYLQIL